MGRRELGAWAGVVGPALFVATFTIEGWLLPGYDARSMFISELALGPRGWIQGVNFVVLGMLLLVSTWGVAAEFPSGKASRAGPVLLAIIGASFLASGFFVMDPATTPRDQLSWHGRLHNLFGALVFSLSPVTCFVFARRFRVDPAWRSLRWWTLAAGAIITVAVIAMSVGPTQPPAPPNAFNAWIGAIQRTAIVPFLVWQFTVALRLLRRRGEANALPTRGSVARP
jgi:hypothetical membrane protein